MVSVLIYLGELGSMLLLISVLLLVLCGLSMVYWVLYMVIVRFGFFSLVWL